MCQGHTYEVKVQVYQTDKNLSEIADWQKHEVMPYPLKNVKKSRLKDLCKGT